MLPAQVAGAPMALHRSISELPLDLAAAAEIAARAVQSGRALSLLEGSADFSLAEFVHLETHGEGSAAEVVKDAQC